MTELPRLALADVPAVSSAEMREIDRLATEDFGIGLPQMMELAGASLARVAAEHFGQNGAPVTVLAGPGNNGGGGLVAARHMVNRGARVHVVLAAPVQRLRPIPRERLATLIEMRVPCCVAPWDLADSELDELLSESELIVDALLGYSAVGPPRGAVAELVERADRSGTAVLSLDLPSGVDPDSGAVLECALRASATMTIALPKSGLLSEVGREYSGQLYVADIGLPAALLARAGVDAGDPFRAGPILRVD